MTRKLLVSLITVGVVGVALGSAAFAYFLYSADSTISVNAANGLDITYDIDQECDGSYGATGLTDLPDTSVGPAYPGDTSSVCVQVNNNNPTDVQLYVRNDALTDDVAGAFLAVLYAKIEDFPVTTVLCGNQLVGSAGYTAGSGCNATNIPASSSKVIKATLLFFDDGTDQSALANATASWDTNLDAYTTP